LLSLANPLLSFRCAHPGGRDAAEAVDRANPQIRISFEAKDTTEQ